VPTTTPLAAIGRGLLAGATGTAAMTAAQTVYYAVTDAEPSTTPAEAARRIIRGVLRREVPEAWTPTLNTLMHWTYGTSWGAVYGVAQRSLSGREPRARLLGRAVGGRCAAGRCRRTVPRRLGVVPRGLAFGALVWSTSLVHLPAMGLAPPVWRYAPSELAPDLGFHLVYGLGAATGHAALERWRAST
jgi:hypothetical protein